MATITSILALQDRMSKPLFNIETGFTKLEKAMERNQKPLFNIETGFTKLDKTMERNQKLQEEANAEYKKWHNTLIETLQTLKNVTREQDNAGKSTRKFSQAISSAGSVAKTAFFGVGKVAAVGLGATATALGGLIFKSLQFGAEMEQNIGGSEAVFGDFADVVGIKSRSAFETMGVSASDFLATANKMTSLMRGSGISIEQSMELSTAAMQRAADVASIMGIDVQSAMESIAGAAKGNFTMMDNLGVAMNAATIEAHAMSKGFKTAYKEMDNATKIGLAMEMFLEKTTYATGNYARENATLSGSLTTAKAAMTNFMTGAGAVDDLVKSFTNLSEVVLKNLSALLPRLTEGISGVLQGLIPQIPPLIEQLLPSVMQGAVTLVSGLISIIPQLISTAISTVPALISIILSQVPETVRQYLVDPFFAAGAFIFKHIESIVAGILPVLAILGVAAVVVGAQMFAAWVMANLPLVAMIAVIVGLAALFDKFGVKIADVTEFIGGVIGGLKTTFENVFISIWNFVADFANFFHNVFKDPVGAIKVLFWDLADTAIGLIIKMGDAVQWLVNLIPGIEADFMGSLKGMQAEIQSERDKAKAGMDWEEIVEKKEYVDITAGIEKGAAIGRNFGAKIESSIESLEELLKGGIPGGEPTPFPDEKMPPLSDTLFDNLNNFDFDGNGNLKTSNQTDIKITDEDIKMLHDIALRRVDVAYQQVTPQVTVNATVREEADFDKLADTFADGIDEAADTQLDMILGV